MSILTTVTKGNKKIASFKAIQDDVLIKEDIVDFKEANEFCAAIESNSDKLTRLREELSALDHADKEQLIRDLFADEITSIIELERKTTIDKALSDAQELITSKIEEMQNDLTAQFEVKEQSLTHAISLFERDKFIISIAQEESLLRLVFASVLKITEQKIENKERVSDLITQIANDFISQSPLELQVSSLDFNTIKALADNKLSALKITLVEQADLLPSSYKLQLKNGNLTFDLEKNIRQFKETLIDTYSGSERVN